VLDVENLRLHYVQTLDHWIERFQSHREQVTDLYDEHFARAWEMYLAGSIAAFRAGTLQLFQVVFTHGDNNELPQNRRDLYQTSAVPEA
jgi:cyclopropane-fatty-acyl-phospholipid synthase